jgi:VanZ family protein
MKFFLRYWLPLFIWMLLIFIGSTNLLSAEQTSRIIGPLLRWLQPDISAEAIAHMQFFVRKGGHVTEYAILAVLFWRALRATLRSTPPLRIGASVALVCALFAASDEFHQSFIATRTASETDVLIDICGALIGLLICAAFTRRPSRHS